jgi:hypothetical protein
MRIGTMFFGRVDDLVGEGIETKFFVLGVPLLPLNSYYFTGGRKGFEIPLHGKSVVLAYARMGLWLGALLWGVLGWVTKHYSDGPEILIGPLVLGGLAAFCTWGVGGVGKAEKPKRLVLRAVTGLAADPAVLPSGMRFDVLTHLESSWTKQSPARPWREAVDQPTFAAEQGPLLYALAAYSRETALEQRVWQRLAAGETSRPGPYRG